MTPKHSEPGSSEASLAIKILVAGGFGVGKTTMVRAVSDIVPLRTEAMLTEQSEGIDDTSQVAQKTTTTTALDFGRITLPGGIVLYLFGTPGQDRFWFMWDELAVGALGGVVLADTRRLDDCFPALDFFERRGLPFVVAVNHFADAERYAIDDVRTALGLPPHIPMLMCDVRSRESAKEALIALVEHVMRLPGGPRGTPVGVAR